MAILKSFQKLERVHIWSWPNCSEKSITSFFESPNIRKSLKEIILTAVLTDVIMTPLTQCSGLQKCTLEGRWKAQNTSLQKFLMQNSHLKELTLYGIPCDDAAAEAIGNMKELRQLILDDCSNITYSGLAKLLQSKEALEELHLENLLCSVSSDQGELDSLKSLKTLYFGFMQKQGEYTLDKGTISKEALKTLVANLQNQLTSFSLKGLDIYYFSEKSFELIGQFKQLKQLRLIDCPQFNDNSLSLLAKSSLQQTLEHLELSDLSLSDEFINDLTKFNNLSKLLLAKCYGLTETGRQRFIHNETLKSRLVALCLGNFDLPLDLAEELVESFAALRYLELINSEPNPPAEDKLFEISKKRAHPLKRFGFSEGDDWNFSGEFNNLIRRT
jgi:hypothetical protein